MDKNIHESSYVDDGAIIGEGTKIWHFSHLMPGCEIGTMCIIGQNCFIGSNVKIGNGVKIQNNVSIYDQIIIEDYVFLGPSVVFTNVINPRAFIERKSEYLKTVIKKGASLGANSTIVCGNTIGKYSLIGAGCVVTKNIKDFALVVGVPCKQIGWVDRFGNNLNLPFKSDEILSLTVGNYTYTLKGDSLYESKN